MLNIFAKYHENQTYTIPEITASAANERTNKHAWSQYLLAGEVFPEFNLNVWIISFNLNAKVCEVMVSWN